MSAFRRFGLAASLLAALAAAQTAQACEIWRDAEGRLRTNCKLSLARKDYRLDVAVVDSVMRYQLALPNLLPRKNKVFLAANGQVDLHVDIRNDGTRDSLATDVALMVAVIDPLGVAMPATYALTAAVPAIPVGQMPRIYLGTITLPNTSQDWDLQLISVVDPPTMSSPVWGRIYESDEMDNGRERLCRIFGPNPDTSAADFCD
jgi:hypothetical protein